MTSVQGGILVVDDDYLIVQAWSLSLEMMGLSVCGTPATVEDAVYMAKAHRPDLVLMDVRLKDRKGERRPSGGIRAAAAIRRTVGCPIIFITGANDPETVKAMESLSPAAILFKPFRPEEFRGAVERATAPSRAKMPAPVANSHTALAS